MRCALDNPNKWVSGRIQKIQKEVTGKLANYVDTTYFTKNSFKNKKTQKKG